MEEDIQIDEKVTGKKFFVKSNISAEEENTAIHHYSRDY